jgi:hypothetical protein
MPIETTTSSNRTRRILTLAVIAEGLVGCILAFWVSLGWLMLAQGFLLMVFAVPNLYSGSIRLLVGRATADTQRELLLAQRGGSGISWSLVCMAILTIALGLLFFWKVNVPIIRFLQ